MLNKQFLKLCPNIALSFPPQITTAQPLRDHRQPQRLPQGGAVTRRTGVDGEGDQRGRRAREAGTPHKGANTKRGMTPLRLPLPFSLPSRVLRDNLNAQAPERAHHFSLTSPLPFSFPLPKPQHQAAACAGQLEARGQEPPLQLKKKQMNCLFCFG